MRLTLRWQARRLLLAPHRLAFFLAMVPLAASGLWWAWMQIGRLAGTPPFGGALPVALVHAAVMVFGFFPLFFSGFLFTAGPKWLRVEPWPTRMLCAPLLALAGCWLIWLVGAPLSWPVAIASAAGALGGMAWLTVLFWRLLLRSGVEDQVHARVVGAAFLVGTVCVAGFTVALGLGDGGLARRFVLSGLWGFAVLVFVTVAHRMLPFFSPPGPHQGHPWGALALLAGVAGFEAMAVWVDAAWPAAASLALVWAMGRGAIEVCVGSVLLWRAWRWAKQQSLRNRLLRMFYIGFVWLGLALVLHGVARGAAMSGAPQWQLAALHALTMGCLASLMLAMVTRVSCGHSGRPQVADGLLWALFHLLQLATVLRMAAALAGTAAPVLLAAAAMLWASITAIWAWRLGSWYGRPRADGRPG